MRGVHESAPPTNASRASRRRHQATLRHSGLLPGREPPSSALSRAKRRRLSAQADKAELASRRLKRELVPLEQVRADVAAVRAAVARELDAFVAALPPRLAGQPPEQMELAIRHATQALLERLSDVAAQGRVDNSFLLTIRSGGYLPPMVAQTRRQS